MRRGTRWLAAVSALAGGLVAVVLPTGATAQRPNVCLLDCPTPTTVSTAPAIPAPPVISDTMVRHVTESGATLTATITTNDTPVLYQVIEEPYRSPPGALGVTSLSVSLPASPTPTPVTYELTDLTPNSRYRVNFDAVDADDIGDTVRGAPVTFSIPEEAAVPVRLVSSRDSVSVGGELTLTSVLGRADTADVGELEAATAPYRHYVAYHDPTDGNPSAVTAVVEGRRLGFSQHVVRNERFRVRLTGKLDGGSHLIHPASTSQTVQVLVFPTTSVGTSRPNPDSAEVQASFEATVHALPSHWRGEDVYFYLYHSTSRRAVGQLIGHVPLRYYLPLQSESLIRAELTFSEPGAYAVNACVRHQILSDMGTPFTDRACGGPTLGG